MALARVKDRSEYTYRCKYCGMECVAEMIPSTGLGPTKRGTYGSAVTPTPEAYVEEMYEATTISFTAESGSDVAYLTDSDAKFVDNMIIGGMSLRVATTSGTNDGDYTIGSRGVAQGKILLSTGDSLTTENAATAGTVTLSRIIYKPLETGTGCGFCQSLNSK